MHPYPKWTTEHATLHHTPWYIIVLYKHYKHISYNVHQEKKCSHFDNMFPDFNIIREEFGANVMVD